jgi:hypothetical protein
MALVQPRRQHEHGSIPNQAVIEQDEQGSPGVKPIGMVFVRR